MEAMALFLLSIYASLPPVAANAILNTLRYPQFVPVAQKPASTPSAPAPAPTRSYPLLPNYSKLPLTKPSRSFHLRHPHDTRESLKQEHLAHDSYSSTASSSFSDSHSYYSTRPSSSSSFSEMSSTAETARDLMEDTSVTVQEKAQVAMETVKRSGTVQNYIMPVVNWMSQKYNQSPMLAKITIMTFVTLSAIPLGCFLGFMGVVTLGCLIVGGIAFTIVEGGFAMFASAFLLPALSLVLLVTGALGLFGGVMFAGYKFVVYVVGVIWGQGQKREVQRLAERAPEKMQEYGQGSGSSGRVGI